MSLVVAVVALITAAVAPALIIGRAHGLLDGLGAGHPIPDLGPSEDEYLAWAALRGARTTVAETAGGTQVSVAVVAEYHDAIEVAVAPQRHPVDGLWLTDRVVVDGRSAIVERIEVRGSVGRVSYAMLRLAFVP